VKGTGNRLEGNWFDRIGAQAWWPGNRLAGSLDAAPTEIVGAAGLEPAYRDLKLLDSQGG
jgi:hypothetical protein